MALVTAIAAHVLPGLLLLLGVRRRTGAVAAVAACVLAATAAVAVAQSGGAETVVRWIPALGLGLSFRIDGLALLMVLLVSVLGIVVLGFAHAYFDRDGTYARFVGVFTAFAGSMTGLVASADLLTMFVFWELTSICSFLLIGLNDRSAAARTSAVRALLTTGAGGLCLLAGTVLLQVSEGTTSFAALAAAPPDGALAGAAAAMVLLGAFTKSAQVPFHFWLPGAMAAPTPVSAYLHSATMVKAGVVLLARTAPAFSDGAGWRWAIVACGGATIVVGALAALRETDAKLLLAQSTVSHLGVLVVLVGVGSPVATFAGTAHLLAHAVFKAGLFLGVGSIDHAIGSRQLTDLGRARRVAPFAAWATVGAAASMAGIPPMLGFVTKEKGLAALLDHVHGPEGVVALVAMAAGSVLSVAASIRLVRALLARPAVAHATVGGHAGDDAHHGHAGSRVSAILLTGPVVAAAAVSLAAGLAAPAIGRLVASAATAVDPDATAKLALWPGFGTVLAVSVAILVAGTAVGLRAPLTRPERGATAGVRAFDATYDGTLALAKRTTRAVQSGSLPTYVAVVAAVVVAALAVAVASGWPPEGPSLTWGTPLEAFVVLATGAFALAVVAVPVRFTAAFLLGGVGLGVSLLFALRGAPDLALTQLLVETLTIVIFLIALRAMPRRFAPSVRSTPRVVRAGIAGAIGILVPVVAWMAAGSRRAPSVAEQYVARSVGEAGGRNVVNVILVDFRGWDTMGEITVLAVAALGVANLVRVAGGRRRRQAPGGEAQ
jgi:multicomponent Na+:H+ antiporter subunit A